MELNMWKLFRELDPSLMSKCKLAKFIFWHKVGFLVLENDDVCIVTNNSSIGYQNPTEGSNIRVSKALKVDSLCGKGVIDFSGGALGLTALTKDGCVWIHEKDEATTTPPGDVIFRKVLFPDGDKCEAKQISQGYEHTLCLTSAGQVFSWGQNEHGQRGTGSGDVLEKDAKQVSSLSGNKIVQVAAGGYTSYALDSSGQVWSWGSHAQSSLGFPAYEDQATPRQIEGHAKIRKIAVGAFHVLALSERGNLFFWGGFRDTNADTTLTPTRINMEGMKPVRDIGSHAYSSLAVCQTREKVYLWGHWYSQYILEPLITQFTSVEAAFAYADHPMMLNTVPVKTKTSRVQDVWKRAFDDASESDIIFSVDGEKLHAHATFLKLRCEHFRDMLSNGWAESNRAVRLIEMKEFSFRVFRAFVYFLYNESLPDPDMSIEDLAELLRAGDYYGEEDLRLAAGNKLRSLLSPENACIVYASAVKSNDKNLQEYTAKFIAPVYKQVVKSAEFVRMDNDLKTKLMTQFADLDVFQVSKKL